MGVRDQMTEVRYQVSGMRHCEERSDEAIQKSYRKERLDRKEKTSARVDTVFKSALVSRAKPRCREEEKQARISEAPSGNVLRTAGCRPLYAPIPTFPRKRGKGI